MNEFESELINKSMGAIHDLELKMTENFSKLQGDMKSLTEKVEDNGKKVDKQTEIETKRLDKHSAEIDDNRERLAKIEEWKDQYQKQVTHRIAISQSITAIGAVVIAFLLSKFF